MKWAETDTYKTDLIPKKLTPLLIAKGELYKNKAVLIAQNDYQQTIRQGRHVITIKFYGEINGHLIMPIIYRGKLINGGDGVFDLQELSDEN